MADETATKDALQVVFTSVQEDYEVLERDAVATCQELEGEGGPSGSSVASRLRSLGGRVTERLKGALRLSVWKALGVVLTHYIINFKQLAMGYIIPDGNEDTAVSAMEQADAAAEGAALANFFEGDLLPDAEDDEDEGLRDGEGDLDSLGREAHDNKLGFCFNRLPV